MYRCGSARADLRNPRPRRPCASGDGPNWAARIRTTTHTHAGRRCIEPPIDPEGGTLRQYRSSRRSPRRSRALAAGFSSEQSRRSRNARSCRPRSGVRRCPRSCSTARKTAPSITVVAPLPDTVPSGNPASGLSYNQPMRLLLAIHNAYTDHTSGAAHSMRILMQWMAEAGHDVRVLATARFDARPPGNIVQHLAEHGISAVRTPPPKAFLKSLPTRGANLGPGRPMLDFTLRGVPVTMLLTSAPPNTPAEQFEGDQFVFLLERLLSSLRPRRDAHLRQPSGRARGDASRTCIPRDNRLHASERRVRRSQVRTSTWITCLPRAPT